MNEQNSNYIQNPTTVNQPVIQPQTVMTQVELQQRALLMKEEKEKKAAKNFIIAWLVTMLAPFALELISSFFYGGLAVLADSSTSDTVLTDLLSGSVMAFASLFSLVRLASHIIIIVGKCKYPKNKSINIAFWIDMAMIICYFIFCIIAVFLLSFTCAFISSECSECGMLFSLI